MNVDLSNDVVSGLQYIQENSECIEDALQILESFVYFTDDGSMEDEDTAQRYKALRNIRYLKDRVTPLYKVSK